MAKVKEDAKEIEASINISEAIKCTHSLKKMARRGWSKYLKGSYLITRRGTTLPVLTNGKYDTAYTPSIEDVMVDDWYEIIE